jgi:succinate dehydrogenase/fumarate reductase flavoprotein subunit
VEDIKMTTWHDYIQRDTPPPEWPYPVRYREENEVTADVLILGGGIAGSHAAISAARRGVKVAVVEVGMTKRSGKGGTGVDHWHAACTNPCSKVTPLEYTQAIMDSAHGYVSGVARYINARESWDTLLMLEQLGVRIRDVDDEFKGAVFRDEETKLMFAYDYKNRHVIRVWGHNIKPSLYNEMNRLGVQIYDRVTATSLLTEGGKQGARVVGATGVSVRTGEFYVFRSKATIISTGFPGRLWMFAPELVGPASMADINLAGVGQAIGWNAGAEFVCMEQAGGLLGGLGYAPYSMGNASNTWHGTPIVDVNGKEVSWLDKGNRELKTVDERFLPAPGQKFMLGVGIGSFHRMEDHLNRLDSELPERILKGEFTPPFFADLTRLPALERRAIFGMMVGNEGKTRMPVYNMFTRAGFDPDNDMLQAPVMPPEGYRGSNFWGGMPLPQARSTMVGGFLVDWDLRTSLEGLYAAGGSCVFGSGAHANASTTGRYSGRKAAAYARTAAEPVIERQQIESEKAHVYSPLKQSKNGIGWKELNDGIARVMQDYCGRYKNEHTLNLGLRLLREIRETEAAAACASNPHELGRLLDCFSLITVGELVINASLARKASTVYLDFYRLDYPEKDPPEWQKLLPIKMENGEVKVRDLQFDYHLKPPYASSYEENYQLHCDL